MTTLNFIGLVMIILSTAINIEFGANRVIFILCLLLSVSGGIMLGYRGNQ